ncbi:MAG: hypothetical protein ACKPH7_26750 [Planktothrix sp.]|uniref:hypothetical protein n=1 Tax=Planktothrix sp. TaxID=3088171 RepID=UPI0038D4F67A
MAQKLLPPAWSGDAHAFVTIWAVFEQFERQSPPKREAGWGRIAISRDLLGFGYIF